MHILELADGIGDYIPGRYPDLDNQDHPFYKPRKEDRIGNGYDRR